MPTHEPSPPPEPGSRTIRADLEHARARRRGVWARAALSLVVGALLASGLVSVWVWRLATADLPSMPDKAALWSLNRPPGVTFMDRYGQVIAVRGPRHGEALSLADLPAYVPRAFLAAEDRRFYSHHGVDLVGVMRAAEADLGARRVVQGGSTITQQVARNIFLSPEQTLRRKLQEAVLAWEIEREMSKDEILSLYLDRTYFGAGAYGVDAAAETYFGKSARTLSLSEAALLAALPKAPTRLDPANDFAAALQRSRDVLNAMREAGWISAADERTALASPPVLAPAKGGEGDYGYVLDLAAARARALAGGRAPDLFVRLTIDPHLQAVAAQVVRDGVAEGRRLGAAQAALVALAPDGGIRALVGGRDYRDSAFDRATQAMRQPGSAFKPFVYATALEAGIRPEDVRTDSPIRYAGWAPENYGGGYSGAVTVADALARSINTISVRLTHEVGASTVAALAQRFGLSMIPSHPSLSIALGAYEVDLLDLVSAYQVFQQDGRRSEPYLVETITDARGNELYRHADVQPTQIYDLDHDRQMVRMMEGVITHGTGRRADIGRPAAGKTGTSQEWRDAWFVGFTPDWVAGVWVGNDRSQPMAHVAGGDLPSEMWRRFMTAAHQGMPVRDFEGVSEAPPAQPTTTGPVEVVLPGAGDATTEEYAAEAGDTGDGRLSPPRPSPAERQGFYAGLAADLGREADGRGGP